MSLEEKLESNGKNKGTILKAVGGLGLLLHSAFHFVPLLGSLGYVLLPEEGALHYVFSAIFGLFGIYYAYQGIKEYFTHNKHGHNGYGTEYAH